MAPESTHRFPKGIGAYVIAILALVVATTTGAYAAVQLGKGVVHTRNIANGAVTSAKVKDHALRLHDLGGLVNSRRFVSGTALAVPANQCRQVELQTINPAPKSAIGSLVVTYLTTASGGAVLDNLGFLVPTVTSATTQHGVIADTLVCAGGSPQTVPAGSVYHYRLLGR